MNQDKTNVELPNEHASEGSRNETIRQDLEERERRLDLALDAGRLGTWEWNILEDKVIWSKQLYEIFGYRPEKFIHTRSGFLDIIHPDDRDYVSHRLDQCFQGRCETYEMEFRVIRGDDQRIVWTSGRGLIVRDAQGHPLKIIAAASDVTERKKWERELVDRERHLRRVIDHQLGLVGLIDRNGILLEVDAQSMNIAGLTRDDVIGKHFAECGWWTYDEAVAQRMRETMDRAFAGETVRYDVPLYAAGLGGSDQRLMIDFMMAPVRDEKGNVEYLIPSGVDISDRYSAGEALKQSEQDLRIAMKVAKFAIAHVDYSSNEVRLSKEAAELYGIGTAATAVSRKKFHALVHRDDRANYENAIEAGIAGKNDGVIVCEHRIVLPDGKIRWLDVRKQVYRDHSTTPPTPTHAILAACDITKVKNAQHELSEQRERLAMAMRASKMGFFEWEPDTNRAVWDKQWAEVFGIPEDLEPSGKVFFEMVHPDDLPGLRDALASAIKTSIYSHEFRIRRPDGSIRWFAGSGRVIPGNNEVPTRLVGLNWDTTESRLLQDQLLEAKRRAESANRAKSEFVANMSHEIRTPMTAVLGYADLLFTAEDDPKKIEYLSTIKRNGEFLLELLNDILDLSKIESGKFEILRENFSPLEIIAEVDSMMRMRANEQGLEFDVVYDGRLPTSIESDPKRLKQILVNLIGNAIKFTNSGSVQLHVRFLPTPPSRLEFKIIDTGIGISAEQQTKLFQPFTQGDASVTRAFDGTGLGLAICRRLSRMLGGEVSVSSKLGQGSTFSFSVETGASAKSDLVDAASNAPVTSSANSATETDKPVQLDCRVLIADDRRDVRFLTKYLLEGAGAQVEEVEDGQLAVEFIERSLVQDGASVDLVLLDMQMPRLDGYAAASQMRELGFSKPIIALTADAMQGDMKKCLECGCDDYLSKPIDAAILLSLVNRLT